MQATFLQDGAPIKGVEPGQRKTAVCSHEFGMDANTPAAIGETRNSIFQWLQPEEAFLERLKRRKGRGEEQEGPATPSSSRPEPGPHAEARRELAQAALQTLRDLLEHPNPTIRIQAALAILQAAEGNTSVEAGETQGKPPYSGPEPPQEPPSPASLEAALRSSFHAIRQARAAGRP